MSSTTVASVEAYTSDTSQPAPDNYAQFSQQEQISVSLVDNNLWLVDSSQLNAQTMTDPSVTLVDWTTKDQTNVSLDNTTAVASPLSISDLGTSGDSSILPSLDVSSDNLLQLPQVTGSLQMDTATTPTGSDGSGNLSSGLSSTSSSDLSSSGDGSSTTNLGTPSSQSTSSTPDSSATTSTTTLRTASSSPPDSTTTSTSTPLSSSNSSSVAPTPVPFHVSATPELILILGILGVKQLFQRCSIEGYFNHLRKCINQ